MRKIKNMWKKGGLIPKLIIAIIFGLLIGSLMPEFICEIFITLSSLFASVLKFIIPLMIVGFVVVGISRLAAGAGKLLTVTTLIAYASTIVAGSLAFLLATNVYPLFINGSKSFNADEITDRELKQLFTIPLSPLFDVTQAIVLAFIFGLCISILRHGKNGSINKAGDHLFHVFVDFLDCIVLVLEKFIIPLLPLYITGTFVQIAYSGETSEILGVFWKVFVCIIALHLVYLFILFILAGAVGKKNPFTLMKNQIPGYLTAIGTQSSAATIPVNMECAKKNGTLQEIREFVIPLCATIHLAGSIITITSITTATLMMNSMDHSLSIFVPFLLTLGVVMIAAPGAPGGAIMAALPFLPMIGIGQDSSLASLLIALYITQDSFGTATNVSGDNAIAIFVEKIYTKFIKEKV